MWLPFGWHVEAPDVSKGKMGSRAVLVVISFIFFFFFWTGSSYLEQACLELTILLPRFPGVGIMMLHHAKSMATS